MGRSSAKQRVLEAMEKLPGDATLEDAIDRLVLAELDAGRGSIPRSGRVVSGWR